MNSKKTDTGPEAGTTKTTLYHIRVWDLPTRLFHWLLVSLVATSFITGNTGGTAMTWHEWSGVCILLLVLFRLLWGFTGGRHSRFKTFLCRPTAVIKYIRALTGKNSSRHIGHNPLGGWSIITMLACLLLQAVTGLFANDDILTEGPLFHWISKTTSDQLTGIHQTNRIVLAALITIHVTAIILYFILKKENLLRPMITGFKFWPEQIESPDGNPWTAIGIVAALAIGLYFFLY